MENEELVSVISNAMASAISEALTPLQSQLDALKAEPKNDVVPGWAKALLDQNKALTDELSAFKGQKITETRLQTLEGKFAGVPDSYKNQRLADAKLFINTLDDNAFNEYLTKTESDIAAFNQELAGKEPFQQKDNNGISSGVATFIQGQTSDLGGKDLHGKTPFNPNPQKQDQGPTTLNGVLTGKTI